MKREIKFRVWDTQEKKFFEPVYHAFEGRLLDLSISLNGRLIRRTIDRCSEDESLFEGRYLIQQFTGLLDKNGKEIYEGDMFYQKINGGKLEIRVIEFHDGGFLFCQPNTPSGWHFEKLKADTIEIIGNIYENPELLK